jgi:site-specific DNA-methyltransferase (adenine-specific)
MNVAYNMDCLAAMREMPDKAFDLCVADPPYGVNQFLNNQPTRLNKYGSMQTANDLKPTAEYFKELFRVSKNQIIWGYNHLSDMLPSTKEFIFWYKHQPVDTYSDGELAWTSFDKTAKCFDYPFFGGTGADKDGRIHPTQKPITLYTWIYQTYTKPGDKILDTHLGSGSSRIAAYDAGLDFVGYEIDKEYFNKQEERYQRHISQISLFVDGAKQEDGAITLW